MHRTPGLSERNLRGLVAGLAALAFVLGACGDDDDGASAGPLTEGSESRTRASQEGPFSAAEIAERAMPSVVRIGIGCQGPAATACAAVGSGWVYDDQGHIVTNNHVIAPQQPFGVARPAASILVNTDDGRVFEAELVGRDPPTDLALLRVDDADLEPLDLTDPGSIVIGEPVVAVGFALDLGNSPSVTTGVVSALDRRIQEQTGSILGALQTDAAINPGNSGGPLIDLDGNVVGVNTAGIQGAEGIGFAIGAATVRAVITQLLETGDVSRAFLGITVREVTPGLADALDLSVDAGVLVDTVAPGTPAAEAGIQPGDVITGINGVELEGPSDLQVALIGHQPGETITVRRVRGDDEAEVEVAVVPPPS